MAELRSCAYQYQHLPLDALRGRWRDAERCGVDSLTEAAKLAAIYDAPSVREGA